MTTLRKDPTIRPNTAVNTKIDAPTPADYRLPLGRPFKTRPVRRERRSMMRTGAFVKKAQVMSADDLRRAIVRLAHEILERNGGADDVVLVGLHTRGVPL